MPNSRPIQTIQIRCQLAEWIATGSLLAACVPVGQWLADVLRTTSDPTAVFLLSCGAILLLGLAYGFPLLVLARRKTRLLRKANMGIPDVLGASSAWRLAAVSACYFMGVLLLPAMMYRIPAAIPVVTLFLLVSLFIALTIRPAIAMPDAGESADLAPMEDFIRTHARKRVRLLLLDLEAPFAYYSRPRPGPTIAVSRGLLRVLTPPERVAVVAHELAHHKRLDYDVRQLAFLAGYLLRLAAVYFAFRALAGDRGEPDAIAALAPAGLVLWLTGILSHVLMVRLTCAQERWATRWTLANVADPEDYLSALRKISGSASSSGEPSWLERLLFATHPSLREVEAQIQALRERRSPDRPPGMAASASAAQSANQEIGVPGDTMKEEERGTEA